MGKIVVEFNGETIEANVVERVHFDAEQQIVDAVVKNVFSNGKHNAVREEWIKWMFFIDVYTDLSLDKFDADTWQRIFDDTDFCKQFEKIVDYAQFVRINSAIEGLMFDMRQASLHPFKNVADKLGEVLKATAEFIDGVVGDENVRNELVESLGKENKDAAELLEKFFSLFKSKE